MNYPWIYDFLSQKTAITKDFKEEWQWSRFMIGGKMFAAICKDEQGEDSLLTLKLKPEDGDFFRQQYKDITPGYYMNKVHWNSINLKGEVPDDVVRELIDKAYEVVFSSLTKKLQKELSQQ